MEKYKGQAANEEHKGFLIRLVNKTIVNKLKSRCGMIWFRENMSVKDCSWIRPQEVSKVLTTFLGLGEEDNGTWAISLRINLSFQLVFRRRRTIIHLRFSRRTSGVEIDVTEEISIPHNRRRKQFVGSLMPFK